jgi:hypothetical protein
VVLSVTAKPIILRERLAITARSRNGHCINKKPRRLGANRKPAGEAAQNVIRVLALPAPANPGPFLSHGPLYRKIALS